MIGEHCWKTFQRLSRRSGVPGPGLRQCQTIQCVRGPFPVTERGQELLVLRNSRLVFGKEQLAGGLPVMARLDIGRLRKRASESSKLVTSL